MRRGIVRRKNVKAHPLQRVGLSAKLFKSHPLQLVGLERGVSMVAEAHWFHMTAHTYGAWLHGDPRGFRTRHHREHIEGDYKNPPPPGTYDDELEHSRASMTQATVILSEAWRKIVGEAVRDRLLQLGAEVIAVAMSATHAHVLAKLPEDSPRNWMGYAKRHAWFVARDLGWKAKLWATRSHALPIEDRGHQENTFFYIARHRKEGAWVWTFRDGLPSPPPVATGGLSTTPRKESSPQSPPPAGVGSSANQSPNPSPPAASGGS